MIDYVYNGNTYKMVLNKNLFACVNVLFMGFLFIEGKQYKNIYRQVKLVILWRCNTGDKIKV